MKINLELSQELCRALNPESNLCYEYAQRGLREHFPDAFYIEGFAVANKGEAIPFEHAWLEVNGQIVDPSWCDLPLPMPKTRWRPISQPHDPMMALGYFPVLRLSRTAFDETQASASKAWGHAPSHFIWALNDPQDKLFTEANRARYIEARAQAQNLINCLKRGEVHEN